MKIMRKICLSALLLLCFSRGGAAPLPALPPDSRIERGTLGCGVAYYMVTNRSVKGRADIAIVRRDESPSELTYSSLDKGFYSRMGIAPGTDGYVSDRDGSTVIQYRNLALYKAGVLDSTLLRTFSQVALSRAEQAVIVCGDIDPAELKKKMDIFSMLVPRILVKEAHAPDYVWEPSPAPMVVVRPVMGTPMVSVSYSSARIPHNLMNTSQALVTQIMGDELETIVTHRLRRNLRDAGVPYSRLRFRSQNSNTSAGDERYGVSVHTDEAHLDAAMRIISSTLAELESYGVSVNEFADSRRILLPEYMDRSSRMPSPEEDVERCISHFIYGATLAPFSEQSRLLARKNIADSSYAKLFNNFTGELIDQLSNLTLEYASANDSLDRDDALFYYNLSYLYGAISSGGKDYSWHRADTLGMEVSPVKIKLKSERADLVTGGKIWTFSNGVQVVFKQMTGSGMFSFSYILNGGLAKVEGINEGEGGYIEDILSLYDAGGLSAYAFRDMILSNGVRLGTDVSVNFMRLWGDAPSSRFPFLMKTLLALANDRNLNWSEFEIYSRNEALSQVSVNQRLESIISPGFAAADVKMRGVLTAETARKADRYFEERFSRMNDGVFVIAGDLDESFVKKVLTRYAGGFRTVRNMPVRTGVPRQYISGTRTVAGEGGRPGIYVRLDAEYPVTAKNFFTSYIAEEVLRQKLASSLALYGFTVETISGLEVKPQERFRLNVTCLPANPDGLPRDIRDRDMDRALSAVRMAIKDAASQPVSAQDLKFISGKVLADTQKALSSPSGLVTTLMARYSAGKDITSRYKESIGSITAADVQAFLQALSSGGRVEYIVDHPVNE